MQHLTNPTRKTKADLIQLYVMVIKEKPLFQYDPKKLILDLYPHKRDLYSVFIPKRDYTISQSVEEHGRLEIREHRFINFLKYTEFTPEEINSIFQSHEDITKSEIAPEQYRYSTKELYESIASLSSFEANKQQSPGDSFNSRNNKNNKSLISRRELDELYS